MYRVIAPLGMVEHKEVENSTIRICSVIHEAFKHYTKKNAYNSLGAIISLLMLILSIIYLHQAYCTVRLIQVYVCSSNTLRMLECSRLSSSI